MLLNVDTWFGRKRQCLQNTLPKDSKETKAEVEDIDTCERYSCALQLEKTKFNLLLSHISWERERLFNRLAVTKRLENEKTIYMDATRLSSICTTAKYLLILHGHATVRLSTGWLASKFWDSLVLQRRTGQFCMKITQITQLQNARIPHLWCPLFKSEFIDSSVLKRHARNRPLPPSQIVKIPSYVEHWLFYTVIRQTTIM